VDGIRKGKRYTDIKVEKLKKIESRKRKVSERVEEVK
jgi:hypothetical protein